MSSGESNTKEIEGAFAETTTKSLEPGYSFRLAQFLRPMDNLQQKDIDTLFFVFLGGMDDFI